MGVMSTSPYLLSFDAASMARFAALLNSAAVFNRYYLTAMNACVNKVTTEAKQEASVSFQQPTGTLIRGINGYVRSPVRGEVGVTKAVSYARRRERGFSGMTDALGRYYPNDPGAFYLQTGLERSKPFIRTAFGAATMLAIREMIR